MSPGPGAVGLPPRRPVRGRAIAAAALALLTFGAGPVPPAPATTVAALRWQPGAAPEAFRLDVPRPALAAFLDARAAALDAERDALRHRVAEALAHEHALLESALLRGLPGFADWAYGWVESYVTAYAVLGEVVGRQVAPGPGGRPSAWDAYRTALGGVVAERFDALVLAPADLAAWQDGAQARLDAVLRDGWAASVAAERAAWDAFLAREARVVARIPAAAPGCAVPPPAATLPAAQPDAPDQTALMTLRAMRPFAGRGGLLALRLGLGAGTAEVTGLLGVLLQPSLSGIASVASGFVVLWAGDWMLSRLDAAVNRSGFEATVAEAIGAHRAASEAATVAAAGTALDAAFAARRGCAAEVLPA